MQKVALEENRVRCVVLMGRQEFGRCPLSARLPTALWPLAGKPILGRLLYHLASEGIRSVAVCCGSDASACVGGGRMDSRIQVTLVTEELTSGTAGCLRHALAADPGDLIVAFSGSIVCPPSIHSLVETHIASKCDLTIVFNPGLSEGSDRGPPAEIYLCQPEVLRLIPAGGYHDIKEELIPGILRAGGTIKPVVLPQNAGNFHDQTGYLDAVALYFRSDAAAADGFVFPDRSERRQVPGTVGGSIDSTARIYGPVAILEGARVGPGAVIVGPSVLDRRAEVGEGSIVVGSVLWEGSRIGARCEVHHSLVERDVAIPDGATVTEGVVAATRRKVSVRRPAQGRITNVKQPDVAPGDRSRRCLEELAGKLPAWISLSPGELAYVLAGGLIFVAFLWSYWATMTELWQTWRRSDEYSAGLLVPFLAAYVLWTRRQDLATLSVKPSLAWGMGVFAFAQIIRGLGLYLLYGSAEMLSIILSVTALILILFGWAALRKVAPVVLFLCLMLPWPHRIQAQISMPLQSWATSSAVFCLELLGYEVTQSGNVIEMGDTSVEVAGACNGLRMVTAFLVIGALVVLLARRSLGEKLVVLASSLPIALLCNMIRLTVTAILYKIFEDQHVRDLIHSSAGYAMMPVALALVVGEFWLLRRLSAPPMQIEPAVIMRRKS